MCKIFCRRASFEEICENITERQEKDKIGFVASARCQGLKGEAHSFHSIDIDKYPPPLQVGGIDDSWY